MGQQDARHERVVVGQGPSQTTQNDPPFTGPSAKRLASLMGATLDEFLGVFYPVNVCDSWQGKADNGKGDAFKVKAGSALDKMLEASKPGGLVLVCGLATARAIGMKKPQLFRVTDWEDRRVAVIPHPSGVNRFWNDDENVAQARAFLSGLWKEAST